MALPIKKQLEDNIVGHWDFRRGTIRDNTTNGNNGTFVGTPFWSNTQIGKALNFDGDSGAVQIADAVSIQDIFDGGGSVSVRFNPKSDGENDIGRIIDKDVGGSDGWYVYVRAEAGGLMSLGFSQSFDNTDGLWFTTALDIVGNTWNYATITYDSSSTSNDPIIYVNGVLVAITEATAPVGTVDSDVGNDLFIGNGVAGTATFDGFLGEGILINTILTSQQSSQLYDEMSQEAFMGDSPTKTILPEQTADVGTPALKLNMNIQGNTVYDVSGNGNDGTVNGDVRDVQGLFGRASDFDGNSGSVQVTDDTTIQDIFDGGGSISAWIYPRSDGEATGGRVFDKTDWLFFVGGESNGFVHITFLHTFSGDDGRWITTTRELALNTWNHVILTYDADAVGNDPTLYVNGSSVTLTETTAPTGTRDTDVGQDLYIGNNSGDSRTFDGTIDKIDMDATGEWTQAQVTELYEQGFGKLGIFKSGEDWEETVSNVTSGFISNTGFTAVAGAWAVEAKQARTSKSLVCKAGGQQAYMPQPYAFGTWEFDLYKPDSSIIRFFFATNGLDVAGADDGWRLSISSTEQIVLTKYVSTVSTSILSTAASYIDHSTWYTFRITRNTDGEFSIYIKGGAFTEWTLVDVSGGSGTNPITDTDVVTSTHLVADLDTDDEIANIYYKPTIEDPTA